MNVTNLLKGTTIEIKKGHFDLKIGPKTDAPKPVQTVQATPAPAPATHHSFQDGAFILVVVALFGVVVFYGAKKFL